MTHVVPLNTFQVNEHAVATPEIQQKYLENVHYILRQGMLHYRNMC